MPSGGFLTPPEQRRLILWSKSLPPLSPWISNGMKVSTEWHKSLCQGRAYFVTLPPAFSCQQGYRIMPCPSRDFFVTPRRPNHSPSLKKPKQEWILQASQRWFTCKKVFIQQYITIFWNLYRDCGISWIFLSSYKTNKQNKASYIHESVIMSLHDKLTKNLNTI